MVAIRDLRIPIPLLAVLLLLAQVMIPAGGADIPWPTGGPTGRPAPRRAVASTPAGPAATGATDAVCIGLGGDALSLVEWTEAEIADHEARFGPVARAHPATGACHDPAGLPLVADAAESFAWLCARTAGGGWYGPVWTAEIYRAPDAVPPDPAAGGCPQPRDRAIPRPSAAEAAAATAVYLSQLEATGDLATLGGWLHPDAQAVVPASVVAGWFAAEWLPRGPGPIAVVRVEIGPWTWPVTGTTYPSTATVAFRQPFADGSVSADVVRLVQDERGTWRWFFGRDRVFVDRQIARFGGTPAAD